MKKHFSKKEEEHIGWIWEMGRQNAPPIKVEWLQLEGNPQDLYKESTMLYLCGGIYRHFLSRLITIKKTEVIFTSIKTLYYIGTQSVERVLLSVTD